MRVTLLGPADLLRVLAASDPSDEARILKLFGITVLEEKTVTRGAAGGDAATGIAEAVVPEPPVIKPEPLAPLLVWQAEMCRRREEKPEKRPAFAVRPVWANAPTEPPVLRPLSSWRDLAPGLLPAITAAWPTADLDIGEAVALLSNGRPVDPLPRETARRPALRLQVVIDRSDRLIPFWDDQDLVVALLRARLPGYRLSVSVFHEALSEPWPVDLDGQAPGFVPPPPGGVVLVLGDLGSLDHAGCEAADGWRRLHRRIRAAGCVAAALLPCPLARCPGDILRDWRVVPWERAQPAGRQDPDALARRAENLLSLVAPAIRIEPGLLRAVRRLLPPGDADAGTEADAWQHEAIASRSPVAATLNPSAANDLRAVFASQPRKIQKRALKLMRDWRYALPHEIWFEEVINLPPTSRDLLPYRDDLAQARDFFSFLDTMPEAVTGDANEVRAWLGRVGSRASELAMLSETSLAKAVENVRHKVRDHVPKAPIDPIVIDTTEAERLLDIRQRGETVMAVPSAEGAAAGGSLLGLIRSANGLVRVSAADDAEDRDPAFWATGRAPSWADAWGRDAYGAWVEFSVTGAGFARISQRMRWIRPGRFEMGSPEDEEGRQPVEGPRHAVAIRQGFWIFDKACSEALWDAVPGLPQSAEAPLASESALPADAAKPRQSSRTPIRGAGFPITEVSWNDVQVFLQTLNALKPGLDLSLPSEAQWEFACRAGTETPYSFGRTISRDQVCYESDAPVEVGSLPPNGWGLFEMHGNIYEWCADSWHGTYEGAPTDGSVWSASAKGAAGRVVRGGSWFGLARDVRAAYRDPGAPAYRFDDVGFRCARVQSDSETGGAEHAAAPADPASRAGAERARPQGPAGDAALLRVGVPQPARLPKTSLIIIRSDREELHLRRLTKPDWASGMGRDNYGLFTEITIPDTEITQRMRWIPPGRFIMGSPDDEPDRFGSEGPRHEVTLEEGFWLFDTPCTQGLWHGVTGKNPSRFQTPDRPVETVSFDDVQTFLSKLNERAPGLNLGLPSEAQWEYACRAGTDTATYAGPITILGEHNAPVLDAIAWYGGNSGVGFDLDDGYNSSGWKEKQYGHTKAGTHPVGLKQANPWGLYDMLGNVYEWCADAWHPSHEGAPTDGSARAGAGAASRVIRGGSWLGDARGVRAAYRNRLDPADRDGVVGFRCARVQSVSASRDAERRTERSKQGERSEPAAATGPKRRRGGTRIKSGANRS